jgi:ABA4-like protein
MQLTTAFSVASTLAAAGWLWLLLSPQRSFWRPVAVLVPLLLAMFYAGLIGAFWTSAEGDFGSLSGVARLFEHPGLLLAGWVHYLAFDLLVGIWEREEAHRIGLSRWILAPCLLLTFWFGPIGWLAFMAARNVRMRTRGPAAAPVAP